MIILCLVHTTVLGVLTPEISLISVGTNTHTPHTPNMGLGQFRPTRDYNEHEIISDLLDEVIPDDYYWDKTEKRGEKWAKMARAFMLRTERTPQDRFTQAANQVGEEISRSAETVKSALTRETFGDEAGVEIPREVLIRVEDRVEEYDDVTLEDILQAPRENQQDEGS
ncbi:hypothetical protein GCM10027355_32390 [Haloplanus salinarum]